MNISLAVFKTLYCLSVKEYLLDIKVSVHNNKVSLFAVRYLSSVLKSHDPGRNIGSHFGQIGEIVSDGVCHSLEQSFHGRHASAEGSPVKQLCNTVLHYDLHSVVAASDSADGSLGKSAGS